jgi:hypothetical protein
VKPFLASRLLELIERVLRSQARSRSETAAAATEALARLNAA